MAAKQRPSRANRRGLDVFVNAARGEGACLTEPFEPVHLTERSKPQAGRGAILCFAWMDVSSWPQIFGASAIDLNIRVP